jgi:TonB family protein
MKKIVLFSLSLILAVFVANAQSGLTSFEKEKMTKAYIEAFQMDFMSTLTDCISYSEKMHKLDPDSVPADIIEAMKETIPIYAMGLGVLCKTSNFILIQENGNYKLKGITQEINEAYKKLVKTLDDFKKVNKEYSEQIRKLERAKQEYPKRREDNSLSEFSESTKVKKNVSENYAVKPDKSITRILDDDEKIVHQGQGEIVVDKDGVPIQEISKRRDSNIRDRNSETFNRTNTKDNQESSFGNSNSKPYQGVGGFSSFSLSGRTLREGTLQRPAYTAQVDGRIVINITVDNYGNVIHTEIGKGTNLDDDSMCNSALESARKAKFNKTQNTNNQTGTITYNYKFN